MKFISTCALIGASALVLSGCVSMGVSQQDSEIAYLIATTAGDVFVLSGKANPDQAGQACLADTTTYNILISTRNTLDNTNYLPADNIHKKFQIDAARLASAQCNQ